MLPFRRILSVRWRTSSSGRGSRLTEALRRLVGYGDFVYRAVREDREQLIVKGSEGTREVVLL